MDLITGLPKSWGYDSVLTIVDHRCSQVAIFLLCLSTLSGPQIAQLYYRHLYSWFRLPRWIISDWDPCFISHFGRALTKEPEITWNISNAYYPQIDGLIEWKNQWLERFLCLIRTNQGDWSTMLPLATLVHNNAQNCSTTFSPNQLISGLELTVTPDQGEGSGNPPSRTKGGPTKAMANTSHQCP